jgi:hypothetical protein
VPKDWLKYYMTVLEKKGDLTLPDNYRGISIADSFSKVHTTMLKHRLQDLYEDLAPQNSNGFRKGRGRTDAIFSLMEVLRRRKQWGLNSWVILFDLYKAFDVIPRAHTWKSMAKMGVTFKMIQVVKSTLEDATCYLHVEQEVREVKMKNGSGQGTSLGQPIPVLLPPSRRNGHTSRPQLSTTTLPPRTLRTPTLPPSLKHAPWRKSSPTMWPR